VRSTGFEQAKPEGGSSAGRLLHHDPTAVVLGDLPDDRQAETGSLQAAGRVGAVEAVEDEGPVGGIDTGAVVADDDLAGDDFDFYTAVSVAPLDGVLDEVPDRSFEGFRISPDTRLLSIEGDVEVGEACRGPAGDELADRVEPEVPQVELPLAPAREVDEVRDERGQLVDLVGDVAEEPSAVVSRPNR
jgi:hypothetical protein